VLHSGLLLKKQNQDALFPIACDKKLQMCSALFSLHIPQWLCAPSCKIGMFFLTLSKLPLCSPHIPSSLHCQGSAKWNSAKFFSVMCMNYSGNCWKIYNHARNFHHVIDQVHI
jgi:hypothetical protein